MNVRRMTALILLLMGFFMPVAFCQTTAQEYFERGNAALEKGSYDEAIADYTKAIRLNPRADRAYWNRGNAHLHKREFDEGEADQKKAIELQLPGVYQRMLENGQVPKTGACLVFVPFPCPDDDAYKLTRIFILKACDIAQKENAHIVIVRYLYGKWGADHFNQNYNREANAAWSRELQDLEEKTEEYVSSGTVKFVNTFRLEGGMFTPWGYLFRDGKPIDNNSLTETREHLLPILRGLERD